MSHASILGLKWAVIALILTKEFVTLPAISYKIIFHLKPALLRQHINSTNKHNKRLPCQDVYGIKEMTGNITSNYHGTCLVTQLLYISNAILISDYINVIKLGIFLAYDQWLACF